MTYLINSTELYDKIDEEISRVAAAAYSENGDSLYDSIVLHSNDKGEIERLQGDAVNSLVKRNYDIITIVPRNAQGLPGLQFNVPDIDTSTEEIIREEIGRYIVLNVCAAWFQARAKDKVEEFAARGQVALDKASVMLHTRKAPSRW